MTPEPELALSIKQPWATLVIAGLKTIEIRRWSTQFRGRVFIHTGRQADDRPEAWAHVPDHLHTLTKLRGGLIGTIEIVDCLTYRSLEVFTQDRHMHYNEPEWFAPPSLYGFRLAHPEATPFRQLSGWVRFFRVDAAPVSGKWRREDKKKPNEPLLALRRASATDLPI